MQTLKFLVHGSDSSICTTIPNKFRWYVKQITKFKCNIQEKLQVMVFSSTSQQAFTCSKLT